jgi:hypothetical protein
MNHQPFREWLLSEEKLSSNQTQELQDHLHSCESCSQIVTAWSEVESEFQKSALVIPKPGFTSRWQAHLIDYQQVRQKRRVWMIISFTALSIIALLGALVTQLWSLLQAPGPFLVTLLNRLLGLVSIYFTFQDIFRSFRGEISIYTFVGMFFLVGIISFMSVLWLTAYQKLSMVRRSV